MQKISLAVTAFREEEKGYCEWLQRAISVAIDHPIVDDIAIVNDGSDDIEFVEKIFQDVPKVHIYQNENNLGVFGNKVESVRQARNPWVVMCDSDNFMGLDYFDYLSSFSWNSFVLYCPSFGRPQLDYRHFHGQYNMEDFLGLIGKKQFGCLLNTGNQFVHRQSFLDVFGSYRQDRFDLEQPDYFNADNRRDEKWRVIYDAADSAWINSTWLKSGWSLAVVKDLHYVHNCLPGSFGAAPKEKLALPPIYLCEMRDILRQGKPRQYKFLRSEYCRKRGVKLIFSVDSDSHLTVWGPDYTHIKMGEV